MEGLGGGILEKSQSTFSYFAFGSNLSSQRIRINNPSARFRSIAKLSDYKLDFNYFSKRWQGAPATLVPHEGEHVWGVLWELDQEHLETLDKQEGVPRVYKRMEVRVELEDGRSEIAYTYYLVKPDEPDKRPSKVYLDVILTGAREHSLPSHYLARLEAIEHNGYEGDVNLGLDLEKINKIPE
ncbi:gamma-glutamylcyclotransferase isoform X2 [Eurytemora carolleeae]|nr:gamma-glutamylcyclotransferase isoform X2 [Eurytemora carolleeae]|eukprot:XP_023326928.1 gamma-glutamylcyclotransferase-like isoform X2 [Eurytemora affinis]